MRINYDAKLNFEDVLLQPKRSTLTSRKDVDMTRKFTFRNSQKVMNFLPIFASNMDGVGTFSMAKVLQEYKMMTVITKTTTPPCPVTTATCLAKLNSCHANTCYDCRSSCYKYCQLLLFKPLLTTRTTAAPSIGNSYQAFSTLLRSLMYRARRAECN